MSNGSMRYLLTIAAVCVAFGNAAEPTASHNVFFDISIGGEAQGRIVMELYGTVVPKTAENFYQLAIGATSKDGKEITYMNSAFHRIIPNFMCQGGDFTRGDGTGGMSIYGSKFPDENFELKHTTSMLLSMANSGKDTNGSQFFITLAKTPWLDGKHVVFGKVIKGDDVVKKMEAVGSQAGPPTKKVVITKSGGNVLPAAGG